MERLRGIKIVDIPENATTLYMAEKLYFESISTLAVIYSIIYLSHGEAGLPLFLSIAALGGAMSFDFALTQGMNDKKTQ